MCRVAKADTSGSAAARRGAAERHRPVSALDHLTHVGSVLVQLLPVFRDDRTSLRWYPFRVPSWNAHAFAVLDVTVSGR